MSGFGLVRTIAIAIGFLMVLGGFAAIAAGGSGLAVFGLWNVVDRAGHRRGDPTRAPPLPIRAGRTSRQPPGPAGGEPPTGLEPRFQPTDEHFEDPTTRQRMRVWLDPHTGERRYLAEE